MIGQTHGDGSEGGNALVLGLALTLVLFGATTAVVTIAARNARALSNDVNYKVAHYLAEGGVSAAKNELGQNSDPGNDGVGTVTVNTPIGDYTVTATELEPSVFQLSSRGSSSDNISVTIQEVVERIPVTRFPTSGISAIGEVDKLKLKIKKHANLLIDGGDRPAIAASSQKTYDEMVEEFAEAFAKKSTSYQLIGNDNGTTGPVIEKVDLASGDIADLTPLYEDLIAGMNKLLPTAQQENEKLGKGTDVFSYGTADNPATVHFTQKVEMKKDDRITGYGTLIISDEFKLKDDSILNWVGDVIVFADDKKKAKLEIDGKMNVTGNIIVLGEGREDVEIKLKKKSELNLVGSMVIGTSNDEDKGKKAKLEIEGSVNIEGLLFVMGGKKIELKFKDNSDFSLNGMMQLALSNDKEKEELKLEFDGNTEIVKDDDLLRQAMLEFDRFGTQLLVDMSSVISYSVETRNWTRTPEGNRYPSGTIAQPMSYDQQPMNANDTTGRY